MRAWKHMCCCCRWWVPATITHLCSTTRLCWTWPQCTSVTDPFWYWTCLSSKMTGMILMSILLVIVTQTPPPKSDSQLTTLTHNNCPIDFVVTPGSFRPSPGLQLRATSLAFAPRRGGECVTHHVGDTEPDDEVLSEGGEIWSFDDEFDSMLH